MTNINYHHMGRTERFSASHRSYVWKDGWSAHGRMYPWLTMTEARADAKRQGARAVFVCSDRSRTSPCRDRGQRQSGDPRGVRKSKQGTDA
jgi:hypothetical protein